MDSSFIDDENSEEKLPLATLRDSNECKLGQPAKAIDLCLQRSSEVTKVLQLRPTLHESIPEKCEN